MRARIFEKASTEGVEKGKKKGRRKCERESETL